MILRKPYAILIKYFKTIHIIMFVFFSYLVFALRKIYIFFREYIQAGSFTYYEDIVSRYVPWILFLIVILVLALSISILLLMHKKEKPVLFYRVMIAYSVLLLGVLIYFVIFFNSLEKTTYEPLRVVVNRDISLFVYLANFFFVIMTFIRGFGFDIKKFSFDRDRKELHLDATDNEEYELNVNIEKEDIRNYFKRQRREFSYYLKANKMFFTIIGSLIIVCLLLFVYFNYFVINKIYREQEDISIGRLVYKVNNSLVTNIDKYGLEISKDNDYLVVNLNITNNDNTGYLDPEVFRINVNEEYFYPSSIVCDLFSDLGNCYKNQELKHGSSDNYVLIYKIGKTYQDIYLEILKNKGDEYNYSKVLLSYKNSKIEEKTVNQSDGIKINNNEFEILEYKLLDKTSYKYEECIEDKCNTYTKKVVPNTGDVLLELKVNDIEKFDDDFYNSAIGIKYNDKVYLGKQVQLVGKYDSYIYYSVPEVFKNTSSYNILLTTRDTRYTIMLEGGYNE